MRSKLGICQWFHYEDYEAVERAVSLMRELGVRRVRTGVSWADFFRPRGPEWYDWQFEQLADFEVLLSIWHTPPSIAEGGACAGPPRRLRDYADFIDLIIDRYEGGFETLELWNEPNNRLKWDFQNHDPDWSKFARMITDASHWAKARGQRTVLGGMIPVDHHWLQLLDRHGALGAIDVIAIHAFPEMWWNAQPNWDWHRDWQGWRAKVDYISHYTEKPIWVTETGFATWDFNINREAQFDLHSRLLSQAAAAPVERVYWYCLEDLDPERPAIEGFHVDENEYHMGVVRFDGTRKPAWDIFRRLLRHAPEGRSALARSS